MPVYNPKCLYYSCKQQGVYTLTGVGLMKNSCFACKEHIAKYTNYPYNYKKKRVTEKKLLKLKYGCPAKFSGTDGKKHSEITYSILLRDIKRFVCSNHLAGYLKSGSAGYLTVLTNAERKEILDTTRK